MQVGVGVGGGACVGVGVGVALPEAGGADVVELADGAPDVFEVLATGFVVALAPLAFGWVLDWVFDGVFDGGFDAVLPTAVGAAGFAGGM